MPSGGAAQAPDPSPTDTFNVDGNISRSHSLASVSGDSHRTASITRQASVVQLHDAHRTASNDAGGACMYHPDLGYVGDGPPESDADVAAFVLRANNPEAMAKAAPSATDASAGLSAGSRAEKQGDSESDSKAAVDSAADSAGLGAPAAAGDVTAAPCQRPPASGSWIARMPSGERYAVLCSDLRTSGFLTPAFVVPALSPLRQQMLLARAAADGQLLDLDVLQPASRSLCANLGVHIDYGAEELTEQEIAEAKERSMRGLGMSDGRHDRVLGNAVSSGVAGQSCSTTGMKITRAVSASEAHHTPPVSPQKASARD